MPNIGKARKPIKRTRETYDVDSQDVQDASHKSLKLKSEEAKRKHCYRISKKLTNHLNIQVEKGRKDLAVDAVIKAVKRCKIDSLLSKYLNKDDEDLVSLLFINLKEYFSVVSSSKKANAHIFRRVLLSALCSRGLENENLVQSTAKLLGVKPRTVRQAIKRREISYEQVCFRACQLTSELTLSTTHLVELIQTKHSSHAKELTNILNNYSCLPI